MPPKLSPYVDGYGYNFNGYNTNPYFEDGTQRTVGRWVGGFLDAIGHTDAALRYDAGRLMGRGEFTPDNDETDRHLFTKWTGADIEDVSAFPRPPQLWDRARYDSANANSPADRAMVARAGLGANYPNHLRREFQRDPRWYQPRARVLERDYPARLPSASSSTTNTTIARGGDPVWPKTRPFDNTRIEGRYAVVPWDPRKRKPEKTTGPQPRRNRRWFDYRRIPLHRRPQGIANYRRRVYKIP